MRENAATKAKRYLIEGRVVITAVDRDHVRAMTRGDGELHRQRWTRPAGWSCTCTARGRCAHLQAVGLVGAVDLNEAW